MGQGFVTRRIIPAIIFAIVTVMAIALTPLYFDVPDGETTQAGASAAASQVDTIAVRQPIDILASPKVVLKSARVVADRSPSGTGYDLTLKSPVIDVILRGDDTAETRVSEAVQGVLAQLAQNVAVSGFEKVSVRDGSVSVAWGSGGRAEFTAIDAQVFLGSRANLSAKGHFTYRGQSVAFDAVSATSIAGVADHASMFNADNSAVGVLGTVWPLRLRLTSSLVTVTLDGSVDVGGTARLAAKATLRTPDTAKLAHWLGYGWRIESGGPAIQISGPLQWAEGALTFGKSQLSLNEQQGTGAVSLRFRDARPLVEATLAFAALDAAPLLMQVPPNGAPQSIAAWRTVSTDFPAIAAIDTDWRLSVERLQWQGQPLGSAAVSVSARDGRLDADFAELEIGPHRGSLQVVADATNGVPEVMIRGRFQSADAGPILGQFVGAKIITGAMASQFEIAGHGGTLDAIVATARGSGRIDVKEGRMLIDLQALTQDAVRPSSDARAGVRDDGWASVASNMPLKNFSAKWQLAPGELVVQRADVQSGTLAATVQGTIGSAKPNLDLVARICPIGAASTRPGRSVGVETPLPNARAITIRGAWDKPVFANLEPLDVP